MQTIKRRKEVAPASNVSDLSDLSSLITGVDSGPSRLAAIASNTTITIPAPINGKRRVKRPPKESVPAYALWLLILSASALFYWTIHTHARRQLEGPYIPSIRSNVSPKDWPYPLIHIVHTRFMQEQANLTSLSEARLALWETFCLPSMLGQTTTHFLWIVRTDPQLDPSIRMHLIEAMKDVPHFYLVASNRNFRINQEFPGAWRDGAQANDLSHSVVYTGNRTLLELAMALESHYTVLETRLDADDGLHKLYLEQMQSQALVSLSSPDVRWMYWCARRHMEWHWMDDARFNATNNTSNTSSTTLPAISPTVLSYGSLSGMTHSRMCITPGYTVGFAPGTREKDVPVFPHHTLVERLKHVPSSQSCGTDPCVQFVETHLFEAIRSRTPTSAGMLHVQIAPAELIQTGWLMYAYWDMAYDYFAINREQVQWMNAYLQRHLFEIATDNLLGQCTSGHSCKVGFCDDSSEWTFEFFWSFLIYTYILSQPFSSLSIAL
jgi:hypothetical protein